MKKESSKNVKTFSRNGLIRQRSLKLKNLTVKTSMMPKDVLLKILKMRETNRLLTLREKELF